MASLIHWPSPVNRDSTRCSSTACLINTASPSSTALPLRRILTSHPSLISRPSVHPSIQCPLRLPYRKLALFAKFRAPTLQLPCRGTPSSAPPPRNPDPVACPIHNITLTRALHLGHLLTEPGPWALEHLNYSLPRLPTTSTHHAAPSCD